MNAPPTDEDSAELRVHLERALAAREEITWAGGYPSYPESISVLMRYITSSAWRKHDYRPAETKLILERLGSASFAEVRSALTAIARSERVCTGSWKSSLENGSLASVVARAEELTKT